PASSHSVRAHPGLHPFPTRRSSDLTATTLDALVLAYTVVAAGVTWQLAVLIGVHKVRSWISRTRVRRAIDAVTGTALIGFGVALDRKSTRLNSSHVKISYAVFCLKK